MANIYVQDWNRKDRILNLATGASPPEIVSVDAGFPIQLNGFTFKCSSDWFSLYAADDALFLNINGRKWHVTDSCLEFKYRRRFLFEFCALYESDHLVFKGRYRRTDVLRLFLGDPSLDGFDEGQLYPLEWLSNAISDIKKQRYLIEKWRSWSVHPSDVGGSPP